MKTVRKAKSKQHLAKRKVRHRSLARGPQTAIVVHAPNRKPWLLSAEEVIILKNSICRHATNAEMEFCLTVARRYELDPFQGQIFFVRRWDSEAERSDGKKGSYIYVPVVAMNGLLHLAARDHKDFGTYSEPEYGEMIEVKYQWNGEGPVKTLKVPEWARVAAFKKGNPQPTVAKVWWTEIYTNIDYAPLVRKMPRLMLAKCARAQATRTAYPKTGGLLIPEETHSREFTDISPGGRIMTTTDPASAAETNWQQREAEGVGKLTPEQQEVLNRKTEEAKAREAAKAQETAKAPEPVKAETVVPCLWHQFNDKTGNYEIWGDQKLREANRDLLEPIWDKKLGRSIIPGDKPEELGRFISQFEQRTVPFRELKKAKQ